MLLIFYYVCCILRSLVKSTELSGILGLKINIIIIIIIIELRYKHQIWHSDSHGYTKQICPTGHLTIQDSGHFVKMATKSICQKCFLPIVDCLYPLSLLC